MNIIFVELFLLILCVCFFSAAEIAFFSLSVSKVKALVDANVKGSKSLAKIKANPEHVLITILLANTIVNVVASSLVTSWAEEWYGTKIAMILGLLTFVILTFGEIIPKSFSAVYSEKIALLVAYPLNIMLTILWPINVVLEGVSHAFQKLIPKSSHDKPSSISEAELSAMTSIGLHEGVFEAHEHKFINNVFQFNDIKVGKIMTPLSNIQCIDADHTILDARQSIINSSYSRIPVYDGENHKVTGIVYLKDLFKVDQSSWSETRLSEIARNPLFVDSETIIDDLFNELRSRRTHIAIVVDKSGNAVGLVTLEDIIEEILGEIEDETDILKKKVAPTKKLKHRVKSRVAVNVYS